MIELSQAEFDECNISVVIPTRNRRRLLALALASVLEQRGVRLEVIVIDEASTDDTSEMVSRLTDSRVRLVRNDIPLGASGARNRGIREATGEWIAFLDDDDLWAPDKLLLQLQALQTTGRSWSYTGAVNITADHRIVGGAPPRTPEEVAETLPRLNSIPGGCSSVVVHKKALSPNGFDPRYRLCPDWDLWIRLARIGLPASVPKPLVGYRVHAGNASFDTATLLAEVDTLENRYGGPIDRVVLYRHVARLYLRMNRQWPALRYYVLAARYSSAYLARGFVADALGVLRAIGDRVRARLGQPRPLLHRQRRDDPRAAWKEEARVWLDEFVRRHTA